MRWAEVAVEATEESLDAVANILIEEGCGGTAAVGSSACSSGKGVRVLGYLPVDDRLEDRLNNVRERVGLLGELGLELGSDEVGVKWVEDDEWRDEWKKFFKPVRVGKIVVKPPWDDYSANPGEIIIELDPGMAFGTGYHPSTRLCLQALQDCIKGGETVLDVGTGSGILAIASVKLGASKAVGLDVDSAAVEVAQTNVENERLCDTIEIRQSDSPRAFDGAAEVVVANIVANVIIEMAEDLCAKLKPGAKLITSGIVNERANEVAEKLEGAGARTVEIRQDGEWTALISERAA